MIAQRNKSPGRTWRGLLKNAAMVLGWAAEKVEDREIRAKIRKLVMEVEALAGEGA